MFVPVCDRPIVAAPTGTEGRHVMESESAMIHRKMHRPTSQSIRNSRTPGVMHRWWLNASRKPRADRTCASWHGWDLARVAFAWVPVHVGVEQPNNKVLGYLGPLQRARGNTVNWSALALSIFRKVLMVRPPHPQLQIRMAP
jgi:hypothetical protein